MRAGSTCVASAWSLSGATPKPVRVQVCEKGRGAQAGRHPCRLPLVLADALLLQAGGPTTAARSISTSSRGTGPMRCPRARAPSPGPPPAWVPPCRAAPNTCSQAASLPASSSCPLLCCCELISTSPCCPPPIAGPAAGLAHSRRSRRAPPGTTPPRACCCPLSRSGPAPPAPRGCRCTTTRRRPSSVTVGSGHLQSRLSRLITQVGGLGAPR